MLSSPIRLLRVSAPLLLAALAGCGGRTTVLEPDQAPDEPNATSASGSSGKSSGTGGATGSASGGKASSATGGKAGSLPGKGGAPAGGATGTAGSSSSGGATGIGPHILNACAGYCRTTAVGPCPIQTSVSECASSCASELSGRLQCQEVAADLLDCLTIAYQNSADCQDFTRLSSAKCSLAQQAYEGCVGPEPAPVPTPKPPPSCLSSGSGSTVSCSLETKCDDGTFYTVGCTWNSADQSLCTCRSMSADGTSTGSVFKLNESLAFACTDSLAICGFPQNGLK